MFSSKMVSSCTKVPSSGPSPIPESRIPLLLARLVGWLVDTGNQVCVVALYDTWPDRSPK